jgi:diadenosine tetraphosphate (Ap4A) HIT family hydrolase
MSFSLHPDLVRDGVFLADWPLCRVLLNDDANFPWLILVPRHPDLRDLHDVPGDYRAALMAEIDRASRALAAATGAEKMNVAALGNVTPQLHIHVIARFARDAAWPRPVWGVVPRRPYGADERAALVARLAAAFGR